MKPSRKKVNLKGKVVKHPTMAYLDIISSIHKLCENLTGHKIEKVNSNSQTTILNTPRNIDKKF